MEALSSIFGMQQVSRFETLSYWYTRLIIAGAGMRTTSCLIAQDNVRHIHVVTEMNPITAVGWVLAG